MGGSGRHRGLLAGLQAALGGLSSILFTLIENTSITMIVFLEVKEWDLRGEKISSRQTTSKTAHQPELRSTWTQTLNANNSYWASLPKNISWVTHTGKKGSFTSALPVSGPALLQFNTDWTRALPRSHHPDLITKVTLERICKQKTLIYICAFSYAHYKSFWKSVSKQASEAHQLLTVRKD